MRRLDRVIVSAFAVCSGPAHAHVQVMVPGEVQDSASTTIVMRFIEHASQNGPALSMGRPEEVGVIVNKKRADLSALVLQEGDPPALPGRQYQFDNSGSPSAKLRIVSRQKHTKGSLPMDDHGSLCHTKWECKYHVVFIPKCRRKVLYGQLRRDLGEVLRDLAMRKECRIEEGHLMPDHVHMMISIPPKYSVSQVIGYMKGKSAIYVARVYSERKRNFVGQHFWARGYFVSTVGRDEKMIREYIRRQEDEDCRLDQLELPR